MYGARIPYSVLPDTYWTMDFLTSPEYPQDYPSWYPRQSHIPGLHPDTRVISGFFPCRDVVLEIYVLLGPNADLRSITSIVSILRNWSISIISWFHLRTVRGAKGRAKVNKKKNKRNKRIKTRISIVVAMFNICSTSPFHPCYGSGELPRPFENIYPPDRYQVLRIKRSLIESTLGISKKYKKIKTGLIIESLIKDVSFRNKQCIHPTTVI